MPAPLPLSFTSPRSCTAPLAPGGRNGRGVPCVPTSAEKRVIPHRLEPQKQNLAVGEESELRSLKPPGPGSQLFAAGDAQSRGTGMWSFRYEVRFAAAVAVKLWI